MLAPPESGISYPGDGVAGAAADDVFLFPATVGQQGFWYLDRLQPGNPAYNIAVRFRLQGPLRPEELERAFNEIVRRHEALRTVFTVVDDLPAQMVLPRLAVRLQRHDLRGVIALAPAADLQRVDELHLSNDAVREFLGVDPAKRPDADPAQLRPAVPVTLVHGEEDATVPIEVTESYAAKHPQARVVRIADCGHYALIDPLSAAWPCVIDEMVRFD